MSYSLVLAQTTDEFPHLDAQPPAAVLACHGTVKLRVHVDNAGVLWQYGRGIAPAPQFDAPPATLLPGIYSLEQRVDAVRFKSLTPGKPAVVHVQALVAQEAGL
jgi:hypothetical protein